MATFKLTFTATYEIEDKNLKAAKDQADEIACSLGFDTDLMKMEIKETQKSIREHTKWFADLDTCDPDWEEFVEWLAKANIKTKTINDCGPGGGFPIIRYIGKKKALQLMISKWWHDNSLWKTIKKCK